MLYIMSLYFFMVSPLAIHELGGGTYNETGNQQDTENINLGTSKHIDNIKQRIKNTHKYGQYSHQIINHKNNM